MLDAVIWGSVAASSLVIGSLLACLRTWPDLVIGIVLAFGAGALIASISFELAEEGIEVGGAVPLAAGLAVGAVAFFAANRLLDRVGVRSAGGGAGIPLALGAFLDGIPEQAVLGIGLATGGVSAALLIAIFVSNLPEAIGSSADMLAAGESRARVIALWVVVAVLCAGATIGGAAASDVVGGSAHAAIDGFAAGALLVMLIDSMIPEARDKAKDLAGLATVVGFAVAAGLSLLA